VPFVRSLRIDVEALATRVAAPLERLQGPQTPQDTREAGQMMSFSFDTTRSIRFGSGLFDRLDAIAAPLLGARIVIVTDPGMRATDMPGRAERALRKAGADVYLFDDVTADPSESVVLAARDRMR
jgi:hypothetical protein